MSKVSINIRFGAFALDVSKVNGLKEVVNDHSTNVARYINTGAAAITLDGPYSGSTTAIRALDGTAVTAPLILNLKNGVKAGNSVDSSGTSKPGGYVNLGDVSNKATSAVINSTGAANVVREITLANNTVQHLTINAQTALTIGSLELNTSGQPMIDMKGFASNAIVTIRGAGRVNLNDINTSIKSINAAENTGGVTFVQSFGGALREVVGGSGADNFTIRGSVTVAGGAGADKFGIVAPPSATSFSTITDAGAGDVLLLAQQANTTPQAQLQLGASATFQDYLNAATAGTTADHKASWFVFGGNTYVVQNESTASTFAARSDIVVKLAGIVDLSNATWASGSITLNSGTSAPAATPVIAAPPPVEVPAGDALVSFKHAAARRIVDVGNVKDLTEVINDRSDSEVTYQNTKAAALTLDAVTAGNTTLIRATDGTVVTDDLTINLKNGTKYGPAYSKIPTTTLTGTIIADDASNGATTVHITSSGAANEVLGMRLSKGTVTQVNIQADSDLNIGNLTPASWNGQAVADMSGFSSALRATIDISGAGKVNLNDLNWLVKAVDATENSGGVTFVQSASGYLRSAIGGAGDDAFTIRGSVVTTGGAGNDVFTLLAPSNGNAFSTITDFQAGDTIRIAGLANSAAPQAIQLQAGATFADYLNASTASTQADHVASWFQFGGNTYIAQNENTAATFTNNSDVVVKLTGLQDLSQADWGFGAIVA